MTLTILLIIKEREREKSKKSKPPFVPPSKGGLIQFSRMYHADASKTLRFNPAAAGLNLLKTEQHPFTTLNR